MVASRSSSAYPSQVARHLGEVAFLRNQGAITAAEYARNVEEVLASIVSDVEHGSYTKVLALNTLHDAQLIDAQQLQRGKSKVLGRCGSGDEDGGGGVHVQVHVQNNVVKSTLGELYPGYGHSGNGSPRGRGNKIAPMPFAPLSPATLTPRSAMAPAPRAGKWLPSGGAGIDWQKEAGVDPWWGCTSCESSCDP
jgi:hypothetical protein